MLSNAAIDTHPADAPWINSQKPSCSIVLSWFGLRFGVPVSSVELVRLASVDHASGRCAVEHHTEHPELDQRAELHRQHEPERRQLLSIRLGYGRERVLAFDGAEFVLMLRAHLPDLFREHCAVAEQALDHHIDFVHCSSPFLGWLSVEWLERMSRFTWRQDAIHMKHGARSSLESP